MLRNFFLALGLLVTSAHAQCVRPAIPRDGLAIGELPVETVTYTDGVTAQGRLIVPTDPPPSCGWPLVVRVHSLGANREQDLDHQRAIAARGYAVWAYDIRGQASTRLHNLQAGTTLYGGTERFDLAEQIVHARKSHAGVVSAGLVAVIGVSQGGAHAWMAAAQSARPLTYPNRGSISFPAIACVVGSDYAAEPIRHRIRGGTLFNAIALDTATLDPLTQIYGVDQTLAATVRQYFLAADPAGLEAWYRSDPARVIEDDLPTCTVPILYFQAWHDALCGADLVLDGLRRLPPTTPWRFAVSTIGHAVPFNEAELRLRLELERRWLDRFLWDEHNGVEDEQPIVSAAMPLDPVAYTAATSLWAHAYDADLPPIDHTTLRLFATDSGTLDPIEPISSSQVTRIDHVVAAGFDAANWLQYPESRTLAGTLAAIPLSERTFDIELSAEAQLQGAPHARVHVTPSGAHFTLAAILSARLPGASSFAMLSHGGRGLLDADPHGASDVEIELSSIAARLPVGTTLRLTLRNHWLTEPPHARGLVTVPMFDDVTLDITHGAGADATWLELPILPRANVSLETARDGIDVGRPEQVPFRLEAGAEHAGWHYLVVASASGQTPATPVLDSELPLVVDGITMAFGMMVSSPELVRFAGLLDPAGAADPILDLRGVATLPIELVGTRLTFAAWLWDDFNDLRSAASGPADVFFR